MKLLKVSANVDKEGRLILPMRKSQLFYSYYQTVP